LLGFEIDSLYVTVQAGASLNNKKAGTRLPHEQAT
jgi:hypothetical protein